MGGGVRDPGNDHKLVSFYVPKEARWSGIREEPSAGLGEHLTNAVLAASQARTRKTCRAS